MRTYYIIIILLNNIELTLSPEMKLIRRYYNSRQGHIKATLQ